MKSSTNNQDQAVSDTPTSNESQPAQLQSKSRRWQWQKVHVIKRAQVITLVDIYGQFAR